MILFLLGLTIFYATHLFSAFARGPRERLVASMGLQPYKGVYSLMSLAGLALVVLGWPQADRTVLYAAPEWARHLTYLLVLVGFVLNAAAYLPKGRIAAAAKHPMLAGVKFWALGHLLVNGDVRSVILFGSLLAYAVVDRIAVKKRGEPTPVAGPVRNDFIAVAVGAAAWAAVYFYLHPLIAGVALR